MRFTQAHFSSLSKSLWVASWPFWCVSCITQLGVTCKLAEAALHLAKSLMKKLNSTGPSTDPWGTPLVTGVHLDIELLTTTLCQRLSNQFLSHRTDHPSNPYLSNLERRTLSGTVSKALLQIDHIHSSSLLHWCSHSITEGHKVCQAGLALGEATCCLSQITSLSSMCLSIASRRIWRIFFA